MYESSAFPIKECVCSLFANATLRSVLVTCQPSYVASPCLLQTRSNVALIVFCLCAADFALAIGAATSATLCHCHACWLLAASPHSDCSYRRSLTRAVEMVVCLQGGMVCACGQGRYQQRLSTCEDQRMCWDEWRRRRAMFTSRWMMQIFLNSHFVK